MMLHTQLKKQAARYLKLQPVFLRKYVRALWADIAQVVFLCNVVSDVWTTLTRLYSYSLLSQNGRYSIV